MGFVIPVHVDHRHRAQIVSGEPNVALLPLASYMVLHPIDSIDAQLSDHVQFARFIQAQVVQREI